MHLLPESVLGVEFPTAFDAVLRWAGNPADTSGSRRTATTYIYNALQMA